jgi:iron complex outermembrane receptor protein
MPEDNLRPDGRRRIGGPRVCLATASILLLSCTIAAARSGAGTASAGKGSAPAAASKEMILFQDLPSVFGASKYEQKPSEAPSTVTIITAEEIDKYGYRSLGEILRSVRGLYVTSDRNYTYVGVRGFARPGDFNTRVLLLLDGHRINDNIYEQAPIGGESIIDVETIDRVEVIRGPSSSLYGTNAFLAVVNVITQSGRDLKGTEIAAQAGSYATGNGSLAYGDKYAGGREFFVSTTYYDSGGQDLYYPEYDTPATNNGVAENVDEDIYGRVFAKLSSGDYTVEMGLSSRQKFIPTASYGTTFNDPDTNTIDARGFVNFKLDRELRAKSRFVGTLSYDAYRYKGHYVYTGTPLKDYGYGQWWTGEAQWINNLGARHKVIGGTEVRYNSQQDQGAYDANPFFSYFKDERDSLIWALYVQDEFRIKDHLILNAGVRHDDYDTFGGTTNPRLALIYGAPEKTTLKVLYGRAFRAPNAYELYYDDGSISQKANPGLEPETIQTYEVALERNFRRGLRGVVSVYQYRIHNLITLETDPVDLLSVFDNVDRVRARGIEVETEGRLGWRLEGRVSYALQETEDATTGDTLTNSPRHLARLNLTVPLAGEKLGAGLEMQYMSPRRLRLGGEAGGHTITNLTFLSRQWKKGPRFTFGVYNLFDKQYGDPGGEEHLQSVIPQDGRGYRLQVHHAF